MTNLGVVPAPAAAEKTAIAASIVTLRIWRERAERQVRGLLHPGHGRHGRARLRAPDPGDAGQRPGVPLELQGGQVRLLLRRDQRQAPPHVHDAHGSPCRSISPIIFEADARRFRSSRTWSRTSPGTIESRSMIPPFKPRPPDARTAPGACSKRTSIASRNSASASSASCARTSATCCATITSTMSSSARAFWSIPPRWKCIRSTPRTACRSSSRRTGIGLCNITKCCTKVCPEHITITDNAIIPLKERVVDEYYDPILGLLVCSGCAQVDHRGVLHAKQCGLYACQILCHFFQVGKDDFAGFPGYFASFYRFAANRGGVGDLAITAPANTSNRRRGRKACTTSNAALALSGSSLPWTRRRGNGDSHAAIVGEGVFASRLLNKNRAAAGRRVATRVISCAEPELTVRETCHA